MATSDATPIEERTRDACALTTALAAVELQRSADDITHLDEGSALLGG